MTIWSGSTPKCQLCGQDELSTFYDVRLPEGPWAMLCPRCFDEQGCPLGRGMDQEYTWTGSVWQKTVG